MPQQNPATISRLKAQSGFQYERHKPEKQGFTKGQRQIGAHYSLIFLRQIFHYRHSSIMNFSAI